MFGVGACCGMVSLDFNVVPLYVLAVAFSYLLGYLQVCFSLLDTIRKTARNTERAAACRSAGTLALNLKIVCAVATQCLHHSGYLHKCLSVCRDAWRQTLTYRIVRVCVYTPAERYAFLANVSAQCYQYDSAVFKIERMSP